MSIVVKLCEKAEINANVNFQSAAQPVWQKGAEKLSERSWMNKEAKKRGIGGDNSWIPAFLIQLVFGAESDALNSSVSLPVFLHRSK